MFFVPGKSGLPNELATKHQAVSRETGQKADKRSSLIVSKGLRLPRTVSEHENGLSREELDRMAGAGLHMIGLGRTVRWFTLGDALLDMPAADALAIRDKFTRKLVRLQKEAKLPQYWCEVRETSGGMHFNIVALCTAKMAAALQRQFASYLAAKRAVQPVSDMDQLMRDYLAKERTTQAGYGAIGKYLGRRRRGSHKLLCGGDRVRVSKTLKRDAIASGKIEPWQETNSRRAETRKPPKLYPLRPKRTLEISGQLSLLPLKDDTRLRNFHGGHMTASQAREAEYQRERIGLSQYQLADAIGCSQPHYANVIRRHDPLSRIAAHRLREVLLGEVS